MAANRSLAGIAVDQRGRLFVAKRRPGGSLGGMWEFPGGKAERGESDLTALCREFSEEFGVAVAVCEHLGESEFSNGDEVYSLGAYRVELLSADFRLTEHCEWRWATIDEIEAEGGFAPSDAALLPMVIEKLFGDWVIP